MPPDRLRVVATMERVIRGVLLRRRGLMGSTEETIGNEEERGRSRSLFLIRVVMLRVLSDGHYALGIVADFQNSIF